MRSLACPKTMAIFVSAPGASSISAAKAATRRPSSRCDPSARPVSTIAGVWMSRSGPPKKRVRTVSVVGLIEAGGGEGRSALEIVARILEQQRRADGLGFQLAEALVGAFVERDVEERRDAQAQMATTKIAQRQTSRMSPG